MQLVTIYNHKTAEYENIRSRGKPRGIRGQVLGRGGAV